MPSKRKMTPELEAAARRLLASATYGEPDPLVGKMASFAHTVVVFLEDFRDGRLTSEEVCDTLLTAAVARKFVSPNLKKLIDEPLNDLFTKNQAKATGSSKDEP